MLITLHQAVSFGRLYRVDVSGGRGIADIEDCVDASIQRLEDYIEIS